jgi:hypothetical protein
VFRKSLVKIFGNKGLDCIFLKPNMHIKKKYHTDYKCITLPREVGDMVLIYLKKAIMETDEDWSTKKK